MTKLLIAALIGVALVTPVQAGGIFSSIATSGWKTVEPDAKFMLEAHGFNLRVYEWTSQSDPNMKCTAVFGETGPTGMQCWKKDANKE